MISAEGEVKTELLKKQGELDVQLQTLRGEQAESLQSKKAEIEAKWPVEIDGRFNTIEINTIYSVLAKIPPKMFGFKIRIVKDNFSFVRKGQNSYIEHTSTLNGRTTKTRENIIYLNWPVSDHTVGHELGHAIYFTNPECRQFLDAKWAEIDQEYIGIDAYNKSFTSNTRRPGFVSGLAGTTKEEDIAEMISLYLTDREKLLKMAENDTVIMQKYLIIDELFKKYTPSPT